MKTKELFLSIAPDYRSNNDPWGHAMGAFFALCDMAENKELAMPAEWGYSPGAGGPACEGYEYDALCELSPSDAELLRLGAFLHRLTGRLDRAGQSY